MRNALKFAPLAGVALLVAACGGGAANNSANGAADNGTVIGNDPMAPDLNAAMPDSNASMNAATPAAPAGNATTTTPTTTNTTNAM